MLSCKTLDEFAFLEVKTINFMSLLLKIKADCMSSHAVTAAYKKLRILSSKELCLKV